MGLFPAHLSSHIPPILSLRIILEDRAKTGMCANIDGCRASHLGLLRFDHDLEYHRQKNAGEAY
jgi:hypothetical protein